MPVVAHRRAWSSYNAALCHAGVVFVYLALTDVHLLLIYDWIILVHDFSNELGYWRHTLNEDRGYDICDKLPEYYIRV